MAYPNLLVGLSTSGLLTRFLEEAQSPRGNASNSDIAERVLACLNEFRGKVRDKTYVVHEEDWLSWIFDIVCRFYTKDVPLEEVPLKSMFLSNLSELSKKHNAYGSRPLFLGGLDGIALRMVDKCCRIVNLEQKGESEAVSESIEDTVFDLLGYAVLGYALIKYSQRGLKMGMES